MLQVLAGFVQIDSDSSRRAGDNINTAVENTVEE